MKQNSKHDENSHGAPIATETTPIYMLVLKYGGSADGIGDPNRLIPEGHRLSRVIAALTGMEPKDVIAHASRRDGRSQRLHVMTEARLGHTLCNLWEWERRLKGVPEPEIPR